ncbi:MAG: hypothetical protein ACR2FM_03670 [Candidatus Saccharimonadales bacterium]
MSIETIGFRGNQENAPEAATHIPLDRRRQFMRTEGFAIYTDVNNKVLEAMGSVAVRPIAYKDVSAAFMSMDAVNPANVALCAVTQQLSYEVPAPHYRNFFRRFGVSQADKNATQGKGVSNHGFADMSFAWHFSSGLASAAVQSFVENDKISEEQAGNLTLGDWANVIGSGWFSKLAHSFAFTGNGYLGQFGTAFVHYDKLGLKRLMNHQFDIKKKPGDGGLAELQLFDIDEELEPYEDLIYLTASMKPEIKTALRTRMQQSSPKSTGCPVARKTAYLSPEVAQSNPHVKNLLKLGILAVKPDPRQEKAVVVTQEYTAIDRTLALIAGQLDQYEALHGNPVIPDNPIFPVRKKLPHEYRPLTNVLQRPV